jgi:hypothetical protein
MSEEKKVRKHRSLRAAINAMCRHCIYDEKAGLGNWRQQVTACTAPHCPLYEVRPLTEGKVYTLRDEGS